MGMPERTVFVMACAALIAACGSGGRSGGTARSRGAQASVRFADCMRSHGVPSFPDPLPTGGFPRGSEDSSPAAKAAAKGCISILNAGVPEPGPSAAQRASMLKFAQCVRAHGILSFPDPELLSQIPHNVDVLSEGALAFPVSPGFDPGSPAFQRAADACGGMGGVEPKGQPKGG